MRAVFSLLVGVPLLAGSAFGWGCEGHQTIALIARAHLTPAASAAVDRLLRENPIDPSLRRFCKDRPNDSMADSSTWADDERSVDRTTEAWHFIDIPLAISAGSVPEKDAMKWCAALPGGKPGCIVSAIEDEWSVLRDRNRSDADRAKALRYVIHFLGDIAQPLHDVDNHDHGGNCTSLRLFAEERPQNLHAIWDYALIQREMAAEKQTQLQYARKIDEAFSRQETSGQQTDIDVLAWAWEGHELARTIAYGGLQPRMAVAPAAAGAADAEECKRERDRVAELRISIGDAYVAQALPVIREQLANAGRRLADLLNGVFE